MRSAKNIIFCKRIIAFTLLAVTLLFAVACSKEKDNGGLSLDESVYLNQTIEAPYPQYVTEKDIDEAIQAALEEHGTPNYFTDRAAVKGDTLNIYYKGVTTDKDGKETAFDGGTYMTFGSPYALTLGSGQFIDGFEDGLVGVIPKNTYRFEKEDESLTVSADSVIRVTYEATYDDKGTTKSKKETDVIVNLADKKFGEDFTTALLGAKAGETRTFDTKYDINADKTADTVSMKATVVEIAVLNPCTVSATFPNPYPNSPDLAGKTVKFYVWVESITGDPTPAELNEKFVTETMKVEVKAGEDAIKVFREYVRENLQAQRDEYVKNLTLGEAWKKLLEKATFKKLPEDKIEEAHKTHMEELQYYFSYYGSYYGYSKIEEFAPLYYGVSAEDFDLAKYMDELAENTVKQELIAEHLIEKHKLGADDQTIEEEVEKLFKEEADAANAQNPSANYTPESVREELEKQYGEGYFEEYVENMLNSERLNEYLISNYKVIFTEETSSK